jgi:hypothetical protein
VFTVAYALSQTFGRDRTAPIGASNHGDQNPERLSLLDYKKKRSINPQGAIGIRTSF